MPTPTPTPIRLAQTSAILLSSSLAGVSLAFSAFLVPRLLDLPVPLMLVQWRATFHQGSKTMPPAAAAAAALYFYLAAAHRRSARGVYYLTAGVLSFGIIPYTVAFMMATNRMLEARAERAERAGMLEEVVEEVLEEADGVGSKFLVDRWGVLNLGRAVMVGVAAVVGAVVTI
ncbi:hypothetical protein B0T18DRAFT_429349 [Schizothecium vesticola]|uniref:DUF1772-domain-containing protein n=1 Tax=Schizothecium vesticola TaxID=314040 RepID=A0AA40EVX4_9PEZI|nr:hypothetical protein B0T18DRAFT_429349 [Schizothecium vesticola]